MNREILAQADPHIQEMWELEVENGKILDRSLQIAAAMIAAALRGEKVEMPGKPDADAPTKDWQDWFLWQGARHLREHGVIS